jgi:uncharacterized membrane protein/chitodextrinase
MRIAFTKYPVDIILCLIWSFALVPIILLDEEGMSRIVLSLPFIFFIPGYLVVSALFPISKTNSKINGIERIALSLGLSLAIVPLLGFYLNFTPWGIRLWSIFVSLFIFVICIGAISFYRWYKIIPNERFVLFLDLSIFKSESKLDKILTFMIVISISLGTFFSIYIIMNPQSGEPFTEFYLFDQGGKVEEYPSELTMGINYSVNLEIDNHEYKTINYTIDIWLINQTTDSGIANWTWDFGDGKFGYGEFITHQYAETGSYIVNLTVKDYDNVIDSIEQTIFVGNNPPVANNDSVTIIEDTTNNIIDILINDFDVDGDDIVILSVLSPSNGLVTTDGSFIYYTPNPDFFGHDQFIYTISDGRGETDTAIVSINVTDINDPPVPNFTYERSSPSTADVIYFYSTSFDSDGYIVNWTWNFGDGNQSYGEIVRHSYIEIGTYIVNLTVKDYDNTINSIEKTIVVRNNIPVAEFNYIPSSPFTANVIHFTSTSIDSDGAIVNWTWNFGDGNQSYGKIVTHQYTTTGSYIVNLTVKDYDNATDSIEQTINVRKKPPVAEFNYIPSSPSTEDVIYFKSMSTSENVKKIIFPNMWFLDKITRTLEHTDIDVEKPLTPQWRYNYSFTINRSGTYKLAFLLFTTPTDDYIRDNDYSDQAENILIRAYRELHLWMDIYHRILPVANFTYSPEKSTIEDNILFTSNSTSFNSSISWWKWDFGDGNISYGETIGLKFDGIDDYVDCGINDSLQPINGTIEAWIYGKDFMGRSRIFTGSYFGGWRRHANLAIISNILILTLTNNSGWEGHTYYAGFQTDIWYHVAVTWDGSQVSFYVNGSKKQTDNQSLIPAGNNDPKRIGALDPPWNPEVFNGIIKDVRIYNRSLNDIEIQYNYDGNVTTIGLVSWWKMNDSGDIADDTMGRNNATIHGADWINQVYHKYSRPGTYNVTLTVSNEYRQIDSISKIINII